MKKMWIICFYYFFKFVISVLRDNCIYVFMADSVQIQITCLWEIMSTVVIILLKLSR